MRKKVALSGPRSPSVEIKHLTQEVRLAAIARMPYPDTRTCDALGAVRRIPTHAMTSSGRKSFINSDNSSSPASRSLELCDLFVKGCSGSWR